MSRHRKRRGAFAQADARNTQQHHGHTAHRGSSAQRGSATHELDAALLLKKARDDKGLTLDDLSRTTKINRKILSALESFDVAHLPSGIYARGFIKAYAREVGLDPEDMANLYLGEIDQGHVPAPEPAPSRVTAAHSHVEIMRLDDDIDTILASPNARRAGWVVTALCAIGLVVYVWSFGRSQADVRAPVADQSPAPVDAAPAASAPASEPDAVRAGPDTPAISGPLHIELRSSGLCWVLVTADGEQVLAKLLRDGDQQTFTANDELRLRVGDPGAFSYSINGRHGRPLGPAGQPINVRITRDNVGDFIQS